MSIQTTKKNYSNRINWVVESGLFQAWINKEYGHWTPGSSVHHEEAFAPLSIFEVQSVFYVYLMFTAISVAAILLEVASVGMYAKPLYVLTELQAMYSYVRNVCAAVAVKVFSVTQICFLK